MEQLTYTPQLFPHDPDRIVPHDEGVARLSAIRKHVEAETEPSVRDGGSLRTQRPVSSWRNTTVVSIRYRPKSKLN